MVIFLVIFLVIFMVINGYLIVFTGDLLVINGDFHGDLLVIYWWLPSGKLLQNYMENHNL